MNELEQLQSEGEDRFKGSEEEERGGEEWSSPFALGKKRKVGAYANHCHGYHHVHLLHVR